MKRTYTKWTENEKQMLLECVQDQKTGKNQISWIKVAQALKNKTPRQCYDQWLQLARTDKQVFRWNDNDCDRLVQFVENGMDFDDIQKFHFPELSTAQVKSKYKQLNKQIMTNSQVESSSNRSSIQEEVTTRHSMSARIPLSSPKQSQVYTESRLSQVQSVSMDGVHPSKAINGPSLLHRNNESQEKEEMDHRFFMEFDFNYEEFDAL